MLWSFQENLKLKTTFKKPTSVEENFLLPQIISRHPQDLKKLQEKILSTSFSNFPIHSQVKVSIRSIKNNPKVQANFSIRDDRVHELDRQLFATRTEADWPNYKESVAKTWERTREGRLKKWRIIWEKKVRRRRKKSSKKCQLNIKHLEKAFGCNWIEA